MNISIKKTVEIIATPAELGNVFANFHEGQMAEFFNAIALNVATWDKPFCFQMQGLTDAPSLTKEARAIMSTIGEYAKESTKS